MSEILENSAGEINSAENSGDNGWSNFPPFNGGEMPAQETSEISEKNKPESEEYFNINGVEYRDINMNHEGFNEATSNNEINAWEKAMMSLVEAGLEKDKSQEKDRARSSIEIVKLSPDDDFEQVAEALYLVDQYIFPDLFGDEEKAKTFTKELFTSNPEALFSFEKTLVAKDPDGSIAGILVYRDSKCAPWDTDAVRERFLATGLELPENFERANEHYMKKITDAELPEGAVEIEFVGVRDDYRSRGIGGKLMKELYSRPEYTEAHLDVLDSHPTARGMYDHLGFEPVGEKFGNYPDGSEGVQHMIRYKKEAWS